MTDFDRTPEQEEQMKLCSEVLESYEWAIWEACARSYGETNEIKMRQKFEEWKESNE